MSKNKIETFFEFISDYICVDGEQFKVYEFELADFDKVTWFLEMLWHVAEKFDVRLITEEGKLHIYLRTMPEFLQEKS